MCLDDDRCDCYGTPQCSFQVGKILDATHKTRTCPFTSTRQARRDCIAPRDAGSNETPTAGSAVATSHPKRPSPRTSRDTPFPASSLATRPPPSSPRVARAIMSCEHGTTPPFVTEEVRPYPPTLAGRLPSVFDPHSRVLDEGDRRRRPRLHVDEDTGSSQFAALRNLREVVGRRLRDHVVRAHRRTRVHAMRRRVRRR